MITPEERKELERQRCEAKHQMREHWNTICQLESILSQYKEHRRKWQERFEAADRALAEEDKLTKVEKGKRGEKKVEATVSFTLEEIHELAARAGIQLEMEKESEEEEEGGDTVNW